MLPGGNAFAAEMLLKKLSKSIPQKNLRPQSLVFDVRATDDGAEIAYIDAAGKVSVIAAKAVVMSCPKFIGAKIINDFEPERIEAIRKLKYRSYLVANVLLNGKIKKNFYDLYLLGNGSFNPSDIRTASKTQNATDVVLANFASPNNSSTVLTLYRAFPYDGARAEIFVPETLEMHKKTFETQVINSILPFLGFNASDIKDIRLARWGHPLPVAAKGLIAEKVVDQLYAPFKEKVFFVEQDNWALPAFETAVTEAINWVPKIEKAL